MTAAATLADVLDLGADQRTGERMAALSLASNVAALGRVLPDEPRVGELLIEVLRLADPSVTRDLMGRVAAVASATLAPPPPEEAVHIPVPLVLLTLERTLPASATASSACWLMITDFAANVGLGDYLLSIQGWLRGDASADATAELEATFDASLEASPSARALIGAARHERARAVYARIAGLPATFPALRERLRSALAVVEGKAKAFDMQALPLQQLLWRLDNAYFRVAVLGEFKRGKSTFINALLDKPGLVGVDALPCTSTLIELRHGDVERYEVADAHGAGPYVTSDRVTFELQSGRAKYPEGSEMVGRWRVYVPSAFLEASRVELVDTPGLGEDFARDRISKAEVGHADAAIVMLDAAQIGSLVELDLVEKFAGRLESLIVVVNRADLVPSPDWARIQDHLLTRLAQRGTPIPRDRVTFVSASECLAAVASASTNWRERFDELRTSIQRHLFASSGPRKMRDLVGAVRALTQSYETDVARALHQKHEVVREFEDVSTAIAAADRDYRAADESIRRGVKMLRDGERAAAAVSAAFWKAWPAMEKELATTKDQWKTDFHPVGSPKRHAEHVAGLARDHLVAIIEKWFRESGAQIVADDLGAMKARIAETMSSFGEFAGGNADNDRLYDAIFAKSLQDSVGAIDTGALDSALASLAGTTFALVIGYVVADVILFYILSLVAGLLNPVILVSAATVGVLLWIAKGEDYVRGMIRDRILTKICSTFEEPATRSKLDGAVKAAVASTFEKIASALDRNAHTVLDEARYQRERAAAAMASKERQYGPIESVRERLVELEAEADAVRRALRELRAVAEDVEPQMQALSLTAGETG